MIKDFYTDKCKFFLVQCGVNTQNKEIGWQYIFPRKVKVRKNTVVITFSIEEPETDSISHLKRILGLVKRRKNNFPRILDNISRKEDVDWREIAFCIKETPELLEQLKP